MASVLTSTISLVKSRLAPPYEISQSFSLSKPVGQLTRTYPLSRATVPRPFHQSSIKTLTLPYFGLQQGRSRRTGLLVTVHGS
uniref:Uncharacterized protein n=1 Tax=Amphimedon queenslandica TaxID=400682 RepID=A0A1X7TAG2_AMPQE